MSLSGRTLLGRSALFLFEIFLAALPVPADEVAAQRLVLPRAITPITLDGDLSDPAWTAALEINTFYETFPGDNIPAPVRTVARLTYDDRFLYVALLCEDPHPENIRAPYVDRDAILGTDDYAAVYLDTRDDRRSAMEFRINPRGQEADAIFNDANYGEDFSPDFFFDVVTRITERGWQAELRIPLSTLRYSKENPQTWGILIERNYPRDVRHLLESRPIPRTSFCFICHEAELTEIRDLPSGGHLVAVPYGTVEKKDFAETGRGASLGNEPARGDGGLDLKWTPSANVAVDGTLNPDFSQVESDVGQISVNSQFALFYPEKRAFFLEGADLFATPIKAVYTRTITDPNWGLRATGKLGATTYTALVAQDRGGGSVVLPGPTTSDLAPQDFRSLVLIGRIRQDFGASFAGLLVADRDNDRSQGGGYNRVIGPDFQWRFSSEDQVTGQWLFSDTKLPDRPDLTPAWDGRRLFSHGLLVDYRHSAKAWYWRVEYDDVGEGFRADVGFVPQVGYRSILLAVTPNFYPKGPISWVEPLLRYYYTESSNGSLVRRSLSPALWFQGGWHNVTGELDYYPHQERLAQGKVLDTTSLVFNFQIDPSRRFSRLSANGFVGQAVDFVNGRVGRGGELGVTAALKPTDSLQLDFNGDVQWLNVISDSGLSGRLFTAQVERIKATYNFSTRLLLRVVSQYLEVERNPSLYSAPVAARSGALSSSALLAYRLNWQSVVFLGYGDDRTLTEQSQLLRTGRRFFLKVSYAFQI